MIAGLRLAGARLVPPRGRRRSTIGHGQGLPRHRGGHPHRGRGGAPGGATGGTAARWRWCCRDRGRSLTAGPEVAPEQARRAGTADRGGRRAAWSRPLRPDCRAGPRPRREPIARSPPPGATHDDVHRHEPDVALLALSTRRARRRRGGPAECRRPRRRVRSRPGGTDGAERAVGRDAGARAGAGGTSRGLHCSSHPRAARSARRGPERLGPDGIAGQTAGCSPGAAAAGPDPRRAG